MTGLILQDWSGGRAIFEVMRQRVEAERAAPQIGGHPPGDPKPIVKEWAKNSVEWQRQQDGTGGPPPQTLIPAHHIGRPGRSYDDEMNEKFRSIGLIG